MFDFGAVQTRTKVVDLGRINVLGCYMEHSASPQPCMSLLKFGNIWQGVRNFLKFADPQQVTNFCQFGSRVAVAHATPRGVVRAALRRRVSTTSSVPRILRPQTGHVDTEGIFLC